MIFLIRMGDFRPKMAKNYDVTHKSLFYFVFFSCFRYCLIIMCCLCWLSSACYDGN